jgi:hypothetical protein
MWNYIEPYRVFNHRISEYSNSTMKWNDYFTKGGDDMSMPRDTIYSEMNKAWETYLEALENSLDSLEKDIEEAKKMAGVCTNEWCEAIEHVIDDLNNALFSISEPRWSDIDHSKRIKTLKRRVYDIYVNYKGVYASAA